MPPLLLQAQSVQNGLSCLLKGTAVGYRRGAPHGLQKNGRAPRGGLHAASRQLQVRYAMARRSVHLVRVSVTPCGEMVGIYRYVAVVYHLAHLGPRYASTSCQVILFCSLSTSMAPPGLVSSAGLFDWTLRLDSSTGLEVGSGSGPEMHSFSSCVVFHRDCHRTPAFSRTKPPYTVPPSLPKANRVEIVFAQSRSLDEAPYPGQSHVCGGVGGRCNVPLACSTPMGFACFEEAEEPRARSCSRGWR
jgi:hypothetical protein